MTPDDVIDVLSAVAAVDRRTVGEADVIMWHQIIGHLPKDLALQAVVDHFREHPGVWLEPGHIVAGVRAIRHDRFQRQSLDEIEAYNDEMDARLSPKIAELADRKTIPDDDLKFTRPNVNPLRVPCPYCHATPGRWCATQSTGQPMRHGQGYHPSHIAAAAQAAQPETVDRGQQFGYRRPAVRVRPRSPRRDHRRLRPLPTRHRRPRPAQPKQRNGGTRVMTEIPTGRRPMTWDWAKDGAWLFAAASLMRNRPRAGRPMITVVGYAGLSAKAAMGPGSGVLLLIVQSPAARSSRPSSWSRCPVIAFSPGKTWRQPVSPNAIVSSVLVQVMFSACPSTGIDSG